MCFERGLVKLKDFKVIYIYVLDSHTIMVVLGKTCADLERLVNSAIQSSKGYVEIELDTINALKVSKEKKPESGVLDTPFYG